MTKDRSTTAKKWLAFKTTEYNHKTKRFETKTQAEWIKLSKKN